MARFPTDVKVFRSDDQGAPALTGAVGSVAGLLYACLVTGYGTTTVSSMTRSGSEVTVTISTGHSFKQYAVIEIAGANESGYNGQHRIESVTSTTFTFTLPEGATPASPATGTITAKMAPAGWERAFVSGDGQRAAFRSTDPYSSKPFLYVDDTNAATYRARVKGYENMSDIDTRSDPFPWSTGDTTWYYWRKSTDDGTVRSWKLFADSRFFWFYIDQFEVMHSFGELIPLAPYDPFAAVVSGYWSTQDVHPGTLLSYNCGKVVEGACLMRGYLGSKNFTPNAQVLVPACYDTSYVYDIYPTTIGNLNYTTYPARMTGGFIAQTVICIEVINTPYYEVVMRAIVPGVLNPLQTRPSGWHGLLLEHDNRVYMALSVDSCAYSGPSNSTVRTPRDGSGLFDIIGPWR